MTEGQSQHMVLFPKLFLWLLFFFI